VALDKNISGYGIALQQNATWFKAAFFRVGVSFRMCGLKT